MFGKNNMLGVNYVTLKKKLRVNLTFETLMSSISILKFTHNKKTNTVYNANIILKSHGIL